MMGYLVISTIENAADVQKQMGYQRNVKCIDRVLNIFLNKLAEPGYKTNTHRLRANKYTNTGLCL